MIRNYLLYDVAVKDYVNVYSKVHKIYIAIACRLAKKPDDFDWVSMQAVVD